MGLELLKSRRDGMFVEKQRILKLSPVGAKLIQQTQMKITLPKS